MLVRSQERYLLLRVGWSLGQRSAYVIHNGGAVRLGFSAH